MSVSDIKQNALPLQSFHYFVYSVEMSERFIFDRPKNIHKYHIYELEFSETYNIK